MSSRGIVLLSGGLDSLVSLGLGIKDYGVSLALTFDYGQKSVKYEIDASRAICDYYKIEHKVINLDWLKNITHTSLVSDKEIPEGKELEDSVKSAKSVWVPNRNGLFLNIAGCFADSENYDYILIGANKEEAQTFSDNTQNFIDKINAEFEYSTQKQPKVVAPLINSDKNDIVKLQEQTVDLVLTAILANGHVLIEGVPGVAKTLLARLTARLIDADFSRVQFTPDLMPSDVLGTTVFNMKTNGFDFHQGPIFADIVLVDEINRAPAKTQAALFEVMEERQISIDGTTHRMGDLYTILATQNPVEQEGTYKLPEAQLDRFLMKITMDYPSLEEEVNILERHHTNAALVKLDDITPAITKEELLSLRAFMNQVFVDRTLLQYIALIVQQTRTSKAVYLGASPRASVAMLQSSKAYALLQGRDFVTPEDIKFVAPYVLQHRLILTAEAEMEGYSPVKVTQRLIDKVEVPK